MFLTVEKMKEVHAKVAAAADADGIQYCLVGGANFKLRGIEGYETPDMDYAADDDISDGRLKPVDDPNVFSWNENGHYDVDGVKIDFINKLSDGTKDLFLAAVHTCETIEGVPCAKLPFAVAIRMAACRQKDVQVVRDFISRGLVSRDVIAELLEMYAPRSRGMKYMNDPVEQEIKKWGSI